MSGQIENSNTIILKMDLKITDCFDKLDMVTGKCKALELENGKLKNELNDLQQYSRLNNLEIRGIPEVLNENSSYV